MYVVLKPPTDGYYRCIKATSDKHFSLEDEGYTEVASGNWYDMIELMRELEQEANLGSTIELFCQDSSSLIQTTEEGLNRLIELYPDYLNNKVFL